MPLDDYKLNKFTQSVSDLPTDPDLSEEALKAAFDAAANELRETMNDAIGFIQGVADGDSGADNIGCTEVAAGYGVTVQSNLEGLKADLDGVALGAIPADSITSAQMAADMKRGVAGGLATYDDFVQKTATINGTTLAAPITLFKFGTYAGDGNASRSIVLGFTPAVVLVFADVLYKNDYTEPFGGMFGMAMAGVPQYVGEGSAKSIEVVANGFDVYGAPTTTRFDGAGMNISGRTYKYIAFK